MNHDTAPAYGLWSLVIVNSLVFIIFAFSFTRPKSRRDWRSLGGFSAFILALFTEMYGFPLTVYLLSGWLGSRFPQINMLSHDAGHLWHTLFGLKGDPHWDVFHLLSSVFIFGGFYLLATSWRVLFKAQSSHMLATSGLYSKIRHPQYVGFVSIMFGFLLQWPTLPTLVMFPILVWFYARLAKKEEADIKQQFGTLYDAYVAKTPEFIPRFGSSKNQSNKPHHTDQGAPGGTRIFQNQ